MEPFSKSQYVSLSLEYIAIVPSSLNLISPYSSPLPRNFHVFPNIIFNVSRLTVEPEDRYFCASSPVLNTRLSLSTFLKTVKYFQFSVI